MAFRRWRATLATVASSRGAPNAQGWLSATKPTDGLASGGPRMGFDPSWPLRGPANVWQSAEGRLRVAQMANLCFVGRRSINRNSAKVLATVPSHVLICSARPPAALFTQQFEELVVETIKRVPCARGVPAHGSLACIAVLPARGIRNIKEYYSTPYDGTEPRKLNCLIADRSLGSEDAGRIEEELVEPPLHTSD